MLGGQLFTGRPEAVTDVSLTAGDATPGSCHAWVAKRADLVRKCAGIDAELALGVTHVSRDRA